MIKYRVVVDCKGVILLQAHYNNLSVAHMEAQEVAVLGASVNIWEGYYGADGFFEEDNHIYSYNLEKEDLLSETKGD